VGIGPTHHTMKATTVLVFLLAVAYGSAAVEEDVISRGSVRKLGAGQRIKKLFRVAGRLFYVGNEKLANLRAPTYAPEVVADANETDRSIVEPPKDAKAKKADKKAVKEVAIEGAQEEVKKAKKTKAPTLAPSALPSDVPSMVPSDAPSISPSDAPSDTPSDAPSIQPTGDIRGFIRCEQVHACNSGGVLTNENDGFWMSRVNRDGVTCETMCTLPATISPRKVLGWECGKKCV
jgi:hypothetical protein